MIKRLVESYSTWIVLGAVALLAVAVTAKIATLTAEVADLKVENATILIDSGQIRTNNQIILHSLKSQNESIERLNNAVTASSAVIKDSVERANKRILEVKSQMVNIETKNSNEAISALRDKAKELK